MPITINPLTKADEPFLWTMLYHAVYVPAGHPPFPPEVIQEPEIRRYGQNWGQPGDLGFVALAEDKPIGAAWLRLLTGHNQGFGYVDENTPELTIAVLPEYRGQGVGRKLLARLLAAARLHYSAVCLSVSPDNPARRLYQKLGFEIVGESGSSLTMIKRMSVD